MKYWINAIGYGLPFAIRLAQDEEQKGKKMWLHWYGRHDLKVGALKKINLILKNR